MAPRYSLLHRSPNQVVLHGSKGLACVGVQPSMSERNAGNRGPTRVRRCGMGPEYSRDTLKVAKGSRNITAFATVGKLQLQEGEGPCLLVVEFSTVGRTNRL